MQIHIRTIAFFVLLFFSMLSHANVQWEEYRCVSLEEDVKSICTVIEQGSTSSFSPIISNIQTDKTRAICDSLKLPTEYALIPFALNQRAKDEARIGLWALSVPVAKHYGLKIDRYYDERFDAEKSTSSALRYIADLYTLYNNYWLTFLAFSHSPAAVNSHIEMFGGDTVNISQFYDNSLFDKEIIARFAAISSIGISLSSEWLETYPHSVPQHSTAEWSSIALKKEVYTNTLLDAMDISSSVFKLNNPCLRLHYDMIPKDYDINIPMLNADSIMASLNSIYDKSQMITDSIAMVEVLEIKEREEARKREMAANRYKVKSGDTLGHIAQRYGVSVSAIKKWNRLRSDLLQIGQIIKIYS